MKWYTYYDWIFLSMYAKYIKYTVSYLIRSYFSGLVGREVAIVMEVEDSKTAASPGK